MRFHLRDLKNPETEENIAVFVVLIGTFLWTFVFLPLVFFHH